MTGKARHGSLGAWLMSITVRLSNLLMPGSAHIEMRCILCGQIVAPANLESHQDYFHPEGRC